MISGADHQHIEHIIPSFRSIDYPHHCRSKEGQFLIFPDWSCIAMFMIDEINEKDHLMVIQVLYGFFSSI